MKCSHILLFSVLTITGCICPRPDYIVEATPEIKEILREYSIREYGITHIDLTRFERSEIEYAELKERMPDECYIYSLADNRDVADEFRYSIIKERDSDKFWVIRYGGFAGIFEIYQLKTEPAGAGQPM